LRLTSRSDAAGGSDTYAYDGNGALLRRTLHDGTWTLYIGGVYELHSDGSVVKYYSAMGKTIAVRQAPDHSGTSAGTLSYLLADQLGSTVGMMDTSGAVIGTQTYWPYGATRSSTGVLAGTAPTDRQYTGQQQEAPAA
jgi:YD repeat-containing protein